MIRNLLALSFSLMLVFATSAHAGPLVAAVPQHGPDSCASHWDVSSLSAPSDCQKVPAGQNGLHRCLDHHQATFVPCPVAFFSLSRIPGAVMRDPAPDQLILVPFPEPPRLG